MLRKDLSQHMKDSVEQHLLLTMNRVFKLESENTGLTVKLSTLLEETADLKMKYSDLEAKIDSLTKK